MRFLLIAFCVFLLSACSSPRTAEDAYKEGNYLESIELVTQDIEQKGEAKLDADDLKRFRRIVGNVMAHYENNLLSADRTDYKSRISSYESLLVMKTRLSNRFYSQQIYFFNNKYDIKQLRQLIAEEYYLYGNSINATDGQSYYLKATLYRKGMESYKYKDIETLYQKTNKKYMEVAAKEYYEQGQKSAQVAQYKLAAEYFSKALTVYKPLGKYKDSDELFIVYDKKYRTIEAQNFYQQAKKIGDNAKTHYEYRQMAQLYNSATSIYSPYGLYLDSARLAKQYQEQGVIKIYFPSGKYNRLFEQEIRKDYIRFVNNQSAADITIKITENQKYREYSGHPTIQALSENVLDKTITVTNEQGIAESKDIYKTHYFNIQTTELTNELKLTTDINVSGIYSYDKNHTIKKVSNITHYVYSGDVPSKYRNRSTGKYLSENKLTEKAISEQASLIRSELSRLSTIFERL